jgi:hypothetical protein
MRQYQHALLGGLFIGVLSALPVVGFLNLCCCLWVVAGGVLTTYLLQQNRPGPVDSGEAALGGLLAGLFGAVLYVLIQTVLVSLSDGAMDVRLTEALESNPQLPPEVRERMEALMQGRNLLLIIAAVTLPVFAVVSLLGALLGVAIFKKKTPPVVPS